MEKIFFAESSAFQSSISAVERILLTHFGIANAKISRTENGKPYLESAVNLFFSVSHTKAGLFIAFSDKNVGLDAEVFGRNVNFQSILRKFPFEERDEIACKQDFLHHWTVKESAVKWLGGTLAHDLTKLSYVGGVLCCEGLELPITVTTLHFNGHILAVCGERDFSNAEFILL